MQNIKLLEIRGGAEGGRVVAYAVEIFHAFFNGHGMAAGA